jgi:hypothetical protein
MSFGAQQENVKTYLHPLALVLKVILLIGIFQVSHLIAVAKKSSITFNTLI